MSLRQRITNRLFKKQQTVQSLVDVGQPKSDPWNRQSQGIRIPLLPETYHSLKQIALLEPTFSTSVDGLLDQCIKRGLVIKAKFWAKCDQCLYEFKTRPAMININEFELLNNGYNPCPVCETGTLWGPDKDQKTDLEDLMENANANEESLLEIVYQWLYDINTLDDCYVILIKDYFYIDDAIVGRTREVLRGDPELMRISGKDNEIGKGEWVCFYHRDFITESPNAICSKPHDGPDLPLQPVFYAATGFGGKDHEVAYIKGEVIHKNKFLKNAWYGMPPVVTLWPWMYSHLKMMGLIEDFYVDQKTVRGIVTFPTDNPDAAAEFWKTQMLELKKNPRHIPILPVPADTKARTEFMRLVDKISEMDLTELRAELKEVIGSKIGASPIFLGSVSTGLTNEGLQLTVSTLKVASNQRIPNREIFPKLLKSRGITDWSLELAASEEEDTKAKLERQNQNLQNAKAALTINLDVELTTDEEDGFGFRYSGKPQLRSLPNPFDPNQQNQNDGSTNNDQSGDQEEQTKVDENRQTGQPPEYKRKEMQTGKEYMSKGDSVRQPGESVDDCVSRKIKIIAQEHPDMAHDQVIAEAENMCRESGKALKKKDLNLQKASDPVPSLIAQLLLRIKQTIEEKIREAYANNPQVTEAVLVTATAGIVTALPLVLSFLLKQFARETVINALNQVYEQELQRGTIQEGEIAGPTTDYIDKWAVEAFQNAKPFEDAFQDLTLDLSNQLREIVADSFKTEKPTLQTMINRMQQVVNLEEPRLETIARTEYHKFFNMGRELEYKALQDQKPDQYLFTWDVREDTRTSELCQTIDQRQNQDGMPLQDLKQLVAQVTREFMGPNWTITDWSTHPNCRSRLVRVT